ncbi:MAG: hypothetical protein OJF47_001586 [Nitrospira sp.]|jgi:hypothetical protein|nr:MAG: hypothetical protein OJF47_001586 [Nitrospira sp.]
MSIARVFMPGLSKAILVTVDEFLNSVQFRPRKAAAFLQPDWIKPKFRGLNNSMLLLQDEAE